MEKKLDIKIVEIENSIIFPIKGERRNGKH